MQHLFSSRRLASVVFSQARNASTGPKAYDAIVIGGGVLGSACALELSRQGRRTLSVDPHPSPSYGSTSASSSIVRVFYSSLESCKLSWEGYWGWQHWADYVEAAPGDTLCSFKKTGGLVFDVPACSKNTKYLSRVRSAMTTLEIPCESWSASDLQERLPYFSMTSYFPPRRIDDDDFGEENPQPLAGGLYTEHTGYIDDPQLSGKNVVDAAQRNGAEFRWRVSVTALTYDTAAERVTGVVLSDGSSVEAPVVVNAAGPHSNSIHQLAFAGAAVADDSAVSSRPMRVEVAYVPGPPQIDLDATMPWVADLDVGIYMRPHMGGQLLVGSSEPACDELHFLEDPGDMRDALSDEWTNYVYRAALRIPELPIPSTASGLAALYDVSPDWTPIYDRTSLGGFYSLRGTSGNQFKNAPVVGKILSRIVDRCEAGHDHDADPLTLDLPHTSQTLDCSIFSRLRKGGDTTGTVLG